MRDNGFLRLQWFNEKQFYKAYKALIDQPLRSLTYKAYLFHLIQFLDLYFYMYVYQWLK